MIGSFASGLRTFCLGIGAQGLSNELARGCREIWPANCATPAQQRNDVHHPSKESAITIPGWVYAP